MTREELLNIVLCNSNEYGRAKMVEFFKSVVVIPKGDRHPHADVLHQWIEGAEIMTNIAVGRNVDVTDAKTLLSGEYMIKPQLPVFEYQYLITEVFKEDENRLSKFMTDAEFISNT